MRVLICYYFTENSIPLGKEMAEAFAGLGHQVHCFDSSGRGSFMAAKRVAKSLAKVFGAKRKLSAHFERRQADRLANDFMGFCQKIAPELIVVIRGEQIPFHALDSMAARFNARTAVWWVKNPRWQDIFLQEAKRFDRAFSIDESICGQAIGYLPSWSVNRNIFFPAPFENKKKGLLFVGTWSPRRQRYLEEIADLPLEIIGPSWSDRLSIGNPLRKKLAGERVSQAVMAAHYRSVWAVIDINQIEQQQEQGVNMRFADVPASGTVLLTEPSREVERWRLAGRGAGIFSSPEELRREAVALLSDKERCEAMSRGALAIASEMPAFVDRARQILESLG